MKLKKVVTVAALGLTLLGTAGGDVLAQQVKSFSGFTVTYSGGEKFAPYSLREDNTKAVVNLSNDTGTAWISANMRNSDNAFRGGTEVQRDTRKEFSTVNASVNYSYKLGLSKTNNTGGGEVTIKGSWAASL